MPKSQITELVLIESRSARNSQISDVTDDRALETLNKAKALVMAVWNSKAVATTAQLAEFYEVGIDALKSVLRRNKEEFEEDGVNVLQRSDLKFESVNLTLSSRTNLLTVWTPRAALRLGMVLRDSLVAKQVRSVVLDIVEQASPERNQLVSIKKRILALDDCQLQCIYTYLCMSDIHRKKFGNLIDDIDSDLLPTILSTPKQLVNFMIHVALLRRVYQTGKTHAYFEFALMEVYESCKIVGLQAIQLQREITEHNQKIIDRQEEILEMVDDPILTKWIYGSEYNVKVLRKVPEA